MEQLPYHTEGRAPQGGAGTGVLTPGFPAEQPSPAGLASTGGHTGDAHQAAYGHYVLIWIGLVSLTALTVALAGITLGRWVILSALTIAGIKSTMVLLNFMHLRTEDRVFRVFVLVSLMTLTIFIVLTFFDYAFR